MGENKEYKLQKFYRHKPGYYCLMADLDRKQNERLVKAATNPIKFDRNIFNDGITWFNEGFLLEEADESMQKNATFVNGYNHAKRLKEINAELENYGREWFLQGRNLEEANEKHSKHPAFIKGYNDAKNEAQIRSLKV